MTWLLHCVCKACGRKYTLTITGPKRTPAECPLCGAKQ